MVNPEEALRLILENVSVLPSEKANLENSVGRVLAEDLYALEDLPPFDNSAMDGFAVRLEDCADASVETPALLEVRETLRAGDLPAVKIQAKEAVRIMTGAPVPQGTEAVVMVEATASDGNGKVKILQAPEEGEHIRLKGEDVKKGDLLLKKGTLIRPYEVALLAAQGIAEIPAVWWATAAVVSTGSELVEYSQALSPGKIRNSNGPALASCLSRWGALPLYKGIVQDDPTELKKTLKEALEVSDITLISGGVSVGDFDYTKKVLEELGLKVIFWKAAIKPGKPLLFGLWEGKPVFGLPGNPVSVLVCLEEFVRPAIEKMQGRNPSYPSYHLKGRLENSYRKEEARQQYLFCQAREEQGAFRLRILKPQGSAMLGMASQANALAIAPIGLSRLEPGMEVSFRWLK